MFYFKKPLKVEAFQYDGDLIDRYGNWYAPDWMKEAFKDGKSVMFREERPGTPLELYINTPEGPARVSEGDYIIRGVEGELYPCKPSIFEKTYNSADIAYSIETGCNSLAEHYGYNPQSRQLIEEMAELTQAINKFWRKDLDCGKETFSPEKAQGERFNNIKEEIADVEILLEQIKGIMRITESDLNSIKVEKLAEATKGLLSGETKV